MMQPGDRVGVAVSGGADSVAMLLLLLELGEKLGVVLRVVHFNHKLRGKASDADEEFVAKLAAKHGLEFHAASVHVAQNGAHRTRRNSSGHRFHHSAVVENSQGPVASVSSGQETEMARRRHEP